MIRRRARSRGFRVRSALGRCGGAVDGSGRGCRPYRPILTRHGKVVTPELGKRRCRRQAMVAIDPALDVLAAPFPSHGQLPFRTAWEARGIEPAWQQCGTPARLAARGAQSGTQTEPLPQTAACWPCPPQLAKRLVPRGPSGSVRVQPTGEAAPASSRKRQKYHAAGPRYSCANGCFGLRSVSRTGTAAKPRSLRIELIG